ncbi:MAG TPA: YceH family protein [Pyrinomonadaceae bacterium]|nr:YceH family protein [Pyrinomonadaceae bacterium]
MTTILDEVEVRVLGSLVEKQVTTPEYYPLTLNALTQACNQKSNRHPVVNFDEATVTDAAESLRSKNLVYLFYGSTSRVPKYKQMMPEVFGLSPRELAIMCVLMLRGPQTVGEIRGRTDRLYDFQGLEEVEETLSSLSTKEPQNLVLRLPRQPGQKEVRYAHLLSGEVAVDDQQETDQHGVTQAQMSTKSDRLSVLEREVEALRSEVETLRREFADFKKQFD